MLLPLGQPTHPGTLGGRSWVVWGNIPWIKGNMWRIGVLSCVAGPPVKRLVNVLDCTSIPYPYSDSSPFGIFTSVIWCLLASPYLSDSAAARSVLQTYLWTFGKASPESHKNNYPHLLGRLKVVQILGYKEPRVDEKPKPNTWQLEITRDLGHTGREQLSRLNQKSKIDLFFL